MSYTPPKFERWEILPAQPGFFALTAFWGSAERTWLEYEKRGIIGWRIRLYSRGEDEGSTSTEPIFAHAEQINDWTDYALLRPDGQVETFDGVYDDIAKWLKDERLALERRERLNAPTPVEQN